MNSEINTNQVMKSNIMPKEENKSNKDYMLQKRIKRVEILNYIIIVLLGILLISNFFYFSDMPSSQNMDEKSLPKTLNKAAANKIIQDIQQNFNNNDNLKLYNVMGDYAQTLISYDDFQESLKKISMFGSLQNASYTNYSFIQHKDGFDWFVLNYVAKYETGYGSATVTIIVKGNEWEVVGFRFYVDY